MLNFIYVKGEFFLPNIKNDFGNIFIDKDVIARIAGFAAMECYGIVGMASKNMKDGFVQLLKKENLTKGIKLYSVDNLINLDMHIIVEFGTNISAIIDTLISTVKYKLEENLGFIVDKINVFVEGVRVD